jgi:hypothetical protein
LNGAVEAGALKSKLIVPVFFASFVVGSRLQRDGCDWL